MKREKPTLDIRLCSLLAPSGVSVGKRAVPCSLPMVLTHQLARFDSLCKNPWRTLCIRRALREEAEALTALILRAKSHWGYDQSFLEACRPMLTLKPESIEHDLVYCAEIESTVIGVSHLKRVDEVTVCLDDLFVEPAFIGQGIGGLLWRHAVEIAKTMGATSLVFGADPHARPFYEHMGAIVEGYDQSTIVPGRQTSRMRYEW